MYRDAAMDSCEAVPRGSVGPPGAANYSACAAGSVPNPAGSACVACPKGTYANVTSCVRCAANQIAADLGSAACSPCALGWVASPDQQKCIRCPAGTYRNGSMISCEPVPANAVSAPASSSYAPCARGSVADGSSAACSACPKGSYEAAGACVTCPNNNVASAEGQVGCAACLSGHVSRPDQQACIACLAGWYRPEDGAFCVPVPPRSVAADGLLSPCAAGAVPNGQKTECVSCPPGSYQATDACVPCASNEVASLSGQTSCAACGLGAVSAPDLQKCILCGGGFYRDASLAECTRVPPGAVAMPGSANYTVCERGSVPNAERTSCQKCEKGTYESEFVCKRCAGSNAYAPEAGSTACLDCPAGSVVRADGQGCAECPRGMFRASDMESCEQCAHGFVTAAAGAVACSVCRNGTEASQDHTECRLCRAGTYDRNKTCEACREGFWSAPGAVACTPCGAGAISSADRSRCLKCPAGTARTADGLNSCLPCKAKLWAPPGSAACRACELGSYAATDSTRCIPCDGGTYMANGTDACVQCPAGSYAPKEGTTLRCPECPAGLYSASDGRSCLPCPAGSYRPFGAGAADCSPCPPASFSSAQGAAACDACPTGQVPREGRATCANCEAGSVPAAGVCVRCAGNRIAAPGDATCTPCPAGQVANEGRTQCGACPAGTYLPSNATAALCERCPLNTVSRAGASGCDACDAGAVSDESQSFCTDCTPGTYRSATLDYCRPCDSGTYSPAAKATACLACSAAQLCPLATSQPIELDFYQGMDEHAAEDLAALANETGAEAPALAARRRLAAAAAARALVRLRLRAARRLLAAAAGSGIAAEPAPEDSDVEIAEESVAYDRMNATVRRAVIKTEESATQRMYRLVFWVAVGVAGGVLLLNACFLLYVWAIPAREVRLRLPTADTRRRRAGHLAMFDRLYRTEVHEAREQAAKRRQWRAARLSSEPPGPEKGSLGPPKLTAAQSEPVAGPAGSASGKPPRPPGLQKSLSSSALAALDKSSRRDPKARRSSAVVPLDDDSIEVASVDDFGREEEILAAETPAPPRRRSVRLEPAPKSKAATEEKPRPSALGAAFGSVGIGMVVVAAAFVLLQYFLANYQVLQSLVVGSSPSVGTVAGAWRVSAAFVGYRGECASAANLTSATAMDAGVHLSVAGIAPLDGSPAPTLVAAYLPAQRSCLVTWSCDRCRATANEAHVEFRLVSRLAFAVAVNFAVRVPRYTSVAGTVRTTQDGLFTVFRGRTPVLAPVLLTPVHFDDARDGSARFDAALQPASNRAAERNEGSFGLCSLTKPLEACPGEAVAFRARFDVNPVYLAVSRETRATWLDAAADLAALAGAAIEMGANLVTAAFIAPQIAWFLAHPMRAGRLLLPRRRGRFGRAAALLAPRGPAAGPLGRGGRKQGWAGGSDRDEEEINVFPGPSREATPNVFSAHAQGGTGYSPASALRVRSESPVDRLRRGEGPKAGALLVHVSRGERSPDRRGFDTRPQWLSVHEPLSPFSLSLAPSEHDVPLPGSPDTPPPDPPAPDSPGAERTSTRSASALRWAPPPDREEPACSDGSSTYVL